MVVYHFEFKKMISFSDSHEPLGHIPFLQGISLSLANTEEEARAKAERSFELILTVGQTPPGNRRDMPQDQDECLGKQKCSGLR